MLWTGRVFQPFQNKETNLQKMWKCEVGSHNVECVKKSGEKNGELVKKTFKNLWRYKECNLDGLKLRKPETGPDCGNPFSTSETDKITTC